MGYLIILAGQILIVSLGGALFSVTPLQPMDWVYIFVATSSVLWDWRDISVDTAMDCMN